MAQSTASLVVRILADIDSFKKGMSDAERELVRTGSRLQSLGQSLSLGITLPFLALGAAISKSAADDEASIKKLEHTFGASTTAMEQFITNLKKTVPETDVALRQLTSSTDVFFRSVGFGTQKAIDMTKAVTTLAGDLAAFNHVGLDVAQSALQAALAGQTRGLKEFGVVISEADIKARAYQLGLAQAGDELSHVATAQAAWSLILEKTKQQQGEAARTIGDDANALARLKQSADAAADSFGKIFLPTAARVVNGLSELLKKLDELPTATKVGLVGLIGTAATLGPTIFIIGSLVEKITLLNRALTALGAGSVLAGITKLAGLLGPLALILGPAIAVSLAFQKEGEAARNAAKDLDGFKASLDGFNAAQLKALAGQTQSQIATLEARRASIQAELIRRAAGGEANLESSPLAQEGNRISAQIDALNARLAVTREHMAAIGATAGDTTHDVVDFATQIKHAEDRAQAVLSAFQLMQDGFGPIPGLGKALVGALAEVESLARQIPNALDPMRLKLEQIGQDIRNKILKPLGDLSNLPGIGAPIGAGARFGGAGLPAVPGAGQGFIPIPGAGQAQFQPIPGLVPPTAAKLPDQLTPEVHRGLDAVREATRQGFAGMAEQLKFSLSPLAQALVHGAGGATGAGLGTAFGAGAGQGLATSIFGTAATGIGAGIGNAVLPVVGGIVGGLAGSLIGGLFDHHKKSVDNSASSLDNLRKTVDKVTESIQNVPTWFKVQTDRFQAVPPVKLPNPVTGTTGSTGSTGGTGGTGSTGGSTGGDGPTEGGSTSGNLRPVIHIGTLALPNVRNVADFYKELVKEAYRSQSTSSAAGFAFASGDRV